MGVLVRINEVETGSLLVPIDFSLCFSVVRSVVTDLSILYLDAQRALELLQQYRAKLDQRQQNPTRIKQGLVEEDHQLHQSLDRVINVFQSQLFSALLGKDMYIPFIYIRGVKLIRPCDHGFSFQLCSSAPDLAHSIN